MERHSIFMLIYLRVYCTARWLTLETFCPSLQQHTLSRILEYMSAQHLDADKQRAQRLRREKPGREQKENRTDQYK